MTTHSRILAWEIPRTEEPGGLQPMGSQKSQTRLSDSVAAVAAYSSSALSSVLHPQHLARRETERDRERERERERKRRGATGSGEQGAQGPAAKLALPQLTENHSLRLLGVREKSLDHTFLSFSNLQKNHFCDAQALWGLGPGGEVRTSSRRPEPMGLTCLWRSSQACSPLRLSQPRCRREAGRTEGGFKRLCSPASRTENSR